MSVIASEVLGHLLEACDLDVADKASFKETIDESYNCNSDKQLAHRVLTSAVAYYESRAPLTKLEKRVIEKLLGSFDQLPSPSRNISGTLTSSATIHHQTNGIADISKLESVKNPSAKPTDDVNGSITENGITDGGIAEDAVINDSIINIDPTENGDAEGSHSHQLRLSTQDLGGSSDGSAISQLRHTSQDFLNSPAGLYVPPNRSHTTQAQSVALAGPPSTLTSRDESKSIKLTQQKATNSLPIALASGRGLSDTRCTIAFNKASILDEPDFTKPKFYTNDAITCPSDYYQKYPIGSTGNGIKEPIGPGIQCFEAVVSTENTGTGNETRCLSSLSSLRGGSGHTHMADAKDLDSATKKACSINHNKTSSGLEKVNEVHGTTKRFSGHGEQGWSRTETQPLECGRLDPNSSEDELYPAEEAAFRALQDLKKLEGSTHGATDADSVNTPNAEYDDVSREKAFRARQWEIANKALEEDLYNYKSHKRSNRYW